MKLISKETKNNQEVFIFEIPVEQTERLSYTSEQLVEKKAKLESRITDLNKELQGKQNELETVNSLITLSNG